MKYSLRNQLLHDDAGIDCLLQLLANPSTPLNDFTHVIPKETSWFRSTTLALKLA